MQLPWTSSLNTVFFLFLLHLHQERGWCHIVLCVLLQPPSPTNDAGERSYIILFRNMMIFLLGFPCLWVGNLRKIREFFRTRTVWIKKKHKYIFQCNCPNLISQLRTSICEKLWCLAIFIETVDLFVGTAAAAAAHASPLGLMSLQHV